MSRKWKNLSWKQQDALILALEERDGKLSMDFLENQIYSSEQEKSRKAMKKLRKNGFIKKTGVGNQYEVIEAEIPDHELDKVNQ